jgi:hypothetical protein
LKTLREDHEALGLKLKDISNIELRADNNADMSLQKDFGGNFLQNFPGRLSQESYDPFK